MYPSSSSFPADLTTASLQFLHSTSSSMNSAVSRSLSFKAGFCSLIPSSLSRKDMTSLQIASCKSPDWRTPYRSSTCSTHSARASLGKAGDFLNSTVKFPWARSLSSACFMISQSSAPIMAETSTTGTGRSSRGTVDTTMSASDCLRYLASCDDMTLTI